MVQSPVSSVIISGVCDACLGERDGLEKGADKSEGEFSESLAEDHIVDIRLGLVVVHRLL
jgi:hypothetical protein